jgi:large subunit ribosomal protein L15
MKLNELKTIPGSKKKRKILGRGNASGHGGTSTRGHKGQKARSGGYVPPWFEGGQMPLIRRIPKRGFVNIARKEYQVINLSQLNVFEKGSVVEPKIFVEKGLVKKTSVKVKILGRGELNKALTVKAHKFSKSALEAITRAGGKAEVI